MRKNIWCYEIRGVVKNMQKIQRKDVEFPLVWGGNNAKTRY
jgi:hypothetical protein